MKLSETAKEVIALATAIRNYWNTELPKRHPNYPVISPGEDSGPPPPEDGRLRDFLDSLPEDTIYKLVLLMYLGRGDFGTEELASQYENVKERFAKPDRAVSQLMGKTPLADYLTEGLEELEKHGINADQMVDRTVNTGS